jgi:hypothetical protein
MLHEPLISPEQGFRQRAVLPRYCPELLGIDSDLTPDLTPQNLIIVLVDDLHGDCPRAASDALGISQRIYHLRYSLAYLFTQHAISSPSLVVLSKKSIPIKASSAPGYTRSGLYAP